MSMLKKVIGVLIVLLLLQVSVAIMQSHAADDIFKGVDISKNGDGSVEATLSRDQTTLTISGTGKMKNWSDTSGIQWYSYRKKIKTVKINQGVTSIGDYAFTDCCSLSNIEISNSVTSIGASVFSDCSSLSSIELPDNITSIEDYTFFKCSSLKNIKFSNSIISIGACAFSFCSDLSSIELPESVINIEYLAFCDCINLKNIFLPKNVITIGNNVFSGCKNLIGIDVDKRNFKFMSEDGILFNKEKTSLIKYPPKKENTNYKIPDGVSGIAYGSFDYSNNLITIEIPNSVTYIGGNAFANCINLINITLPNSLTRIEYSTFMECSSLNNVILPKNLEFIQSQAFLGCSSLKNIEIPGSVTSIGDRAFSSCSSLSSIIIPKEVTSIGSGVFNSCSNLTITCKGGTTAEIYAKDNNIKYVADNELKIKDIKYSTKKLTNQNVIVTITGEEKLREIIGWNLSEDRKILTKTYEENIEEEITIMDLVGNERKETIKITNIDKEAPEIKEVKKEPSTPTNKNVTEEIEANEEIQLPEGWSYKGENKGIITKEYKENTTEEVTVKDIAGNEAKEKVIVEINNIDKMAPEVEVSYSTKELTKEKVKVTITANEEIQGVTGWTLSQDKKTLTKTYETNTTEEITVKDVAGNEAKAIIEIENIIDTILPKIMEIKYSTTEITNQDVTVMITANEYIELPKGWSYKEVKNIITKTYEANTEEEVIIKDLSGNEAEEKVTVEINNIDRTAPIVTVNKTLSNDKTKSTVMLTADEQIQGVTGWTLSQDKKTLTKTYTANTTEEVTVKDLAGNESKGTISITNIVTETTVNVNTYTVENNIIKNIQPSTSYTDLIKNITSNKEIVVKEGSTVVTGTNKIKTGEVLTTGEKTYTLVVTGDTNGDGQADIKDILQINKHRLNKAQLTSVYFTAGDVNKDGKVDIKDILQLNKYRLGKIIQL